MQPDPAGRRRRTMVLDQVLSGGSNVLVAVLAARALSAHGFGLFGITFLVYVFCSAAVRALLDEPLLVHADEVEADPAGPVGAGLCLGAVGAVLVAGAGAVVLLTGGEDLGTALLVLAGCLPLLVVQDLGRYLSFTLRTPGDAVVLDAVWLVLMLAGILAWPAVGLPAGLAALVVPWAVAGAIAGLLPLWRLRSHRIRPGLSWLGVTWSFSWRYLLSFLAGQGGVLAGTVALSGVAGPAALGGVRGTQLLLRPFMAVFAATNASGVAEVARHDTGAHPLQRHLLRLTLLPTLAAAVNGVALLVLPETVGKALLGDTWQVARTMLWPATVQMLLMGLWVGARIGLVGRRAVRTTTRLVLVLTPVTVALALAGAAVDGGPGFFWGAAAGQALVTAIWWWRSARLRDEGPVATSAGTAQPSSASW